MVWDEVFGHGCQTIKPVDLAIMVGDKRASENGMASKKAEDTIKRKRGIRAVEILGMLSLYHYFFISFSV